MPAIELKLDKTSFGSSVHFTGVVAPDGSTGYTFSGTLTVTCMVDRKDVHFANVVRIGHGGVSGKYNHLDTELSNTSVLGKKITIDGKGTRAANEDVEFYVAMNEGASGQFAESPEVTCSVGGPPQKVVEAYVIKDSNDNIKYDVGFDGVARADGPTGFVIEGQLDAYSMPGALTSQFATFGYGSASGSWEYRTVNIADAPQEIKVYGSRQAGEKIEVIVGVTGGLANSWLYGSASTYELPDQF
jgi:hypothetical protein